MKIIHSFTLTNDQNPVIIIAKSESKVSENIVKHIPFLDRRIETPLHEKAFNSTLKLLVIGIMFYQARQQHINTIPTPPKTSLPVVQAEPLTPMLPISIEQSSNVAAPIVLPDNMYNVLHRVGNVLTPIGLCALVIFLFIKLTNYPFYKVYVILKDIIITFRNSISSFADGTQSTVTSILMGGANTANYVASAVINPALITSEMLNAYTQQVIEKEKKDDYLTRAAFLHTMATKQGIYLTKNNNNSFWLDTTGELYIDLETDKRIKRKVIDIIAAATTPNAESSVIDSVLKILDFNLPTAAALNVRNSTNTPTSLEDLNKFLDTHLRLLKEEVKAPKTITLLKNITARSEFQAISSVVSVPLLLFVSLHIERNFILWCKAVALHYNLQLFARIPKQIATPNVGTFLQSMAKKLPFIGNKLVPSNDHILPNSAVLIFKNTLIERLSSTHPALSKILTEVLPNNIFELITIPFVYIFIVPNYNKALSQALYGIFFSLENFFINRNKKQNSFFQLVEEFKTNATQGVSTPSNTPKK
jgi:hypothetical protein